ncbi:hypothetical protein OAS39_09040 [Pirellulales bacterium]|nr:hypothetical protein [Pirellulales bacterium]
MTIAELRNGNEYWVTGSTEWSVDAQQLFALSGVWSFIKDTVAEEDVIL